jgi:small subunit ribosomal protein S21
MDQDHRLRFDIRMCWPVGSGSSPSRQHLCRGNSERSAYPVQVSVRDNNVDQALRALKKKMQREGIFREMKLRRNYEKPSEKKARERAEAVRRYRKLMRKRMEREGY